MMRLRQSIGSVLSAGGAAVRGWTALAAALAIPVGPARADAVFRLSSTAFQEGGSLALKYGGNRPGHAVCIGSNVSPPIAWSNVPAGTRSIAMIMVDPEGDSGAGTAHWVAYGIDPAKGGFAEGEASLPPKGYVGGRSSQGYDHYSGPCAAPGAETHHFIWVVSATDYPPDALPPGLTKDQLGQKLVGHALGTAGLAAHYVHPRQPAPAAGHGRGAGRQGSGK